MRVLESMIDDDIDSQIRDDISAIEDTLVLLGLMNRPQAMRWLERDYSVRNRWGPQLTDVEREEVREEVKEEFESIYQTASEASKGIEAIPQFRDYNIDLKDLPDEDRIQSHIDAFSNSDYFQDAFGQVPDGYWKIKLVPLNALVAYQPHVTTSAHTEIPTSEEGYLDVLEYCLPIDVKNYIQVEDRSIPDYSASARFVSRNPNINFSGPSIESIEHRPPGNISVTFNIKSRPNFVQVAHFNDRYILKNGYHRSYQLLREGEEYVPAVVLYAQDYADTGAKGVGWFQKQSIMGARPPLVWDFFTEAAVELETKVQNKMIRVLAEKLDVER